MTPLLIIALPDSQAPIVWWASDTYVVAAVTRLEESTVPFDEACQRYADLHGEAHFFESQEKAQAWADTYTGPNWLEVRAAVARAPSQPPKDLGLTD
jgi:hypothetical protein